ncbi:hypothetical protein [Streptomyces sp. NPDC005141]
MLSAHVVGVARGSSDGGTDTAIVVGAAHLAGRRLALCRPVLLHLPGTVLGHSSICRAR